MGLKYQIRHGFLTATLLAVFGSAQAQTTTSTATLKATTDTAVIRIGEQFRLTLEAQVPEGTRFYWPALPDTFQGFEVVRRPQPDSAGVRQPLRKQEYILTSFDSGFKVIPPLTAYYFHRGNTDTLMASTEPLLITINAMPVDTTKAIRDIKDLQRYPYTWQDALPWVFGGLLLALIGYLVYVLMKRRKRKAVPEVPVIRIPAHEKALQALRALAEQKLWQSGQIKPYYTGVTDIIRQYLADTRGINAPEMTTNEILSTNILNSFSKDKFNLLKQLLESADLVKFAKVQPLPTEHEQAMAMAVSFVETDHRDRQPAVPKPVAS